MATNRSRRLRKKLRVDEFQEFGFDIQWTFEESVSEQDIDSLIDQFIHEVIEPRQLGFHGGGHKEWQGIIATQHIGKCTDEDIAVITDFWKSKPVKDVEATTLYDIWWG
ncbi:50S ribosome-binding protein YggL [Shewanella sp. HL-SH8]|jgi:uncharacterized protein YggL (DUF469 family)|uniref:50S ribosome-binding protein YggL n=1 Tax=Shewanella TaxID=22 RepID=UPI001CF7F2AF|nr:MULTISPECIES: 50S ribosome-binding protein YggL [Shewanella]UCX03952.1 DUF469 family protein [Shewanella glacialimarina]UJF23112.1 50S ribosome-binding protein YggL [Shewanella sp. OMA3-2]